MDAGPRTKQRRATKRLLRGSCGLAPRRRCQPGSGATRAESVFPTTREGPARRGRRRHAVVVEALVPADAARVKIRIATRIATVYTNAPKWHREAILANLCTLLRRRLGGEAHVARAVTQPPTRTHEASAYGLFRGPCGLTPRRRCRPGSGAARAESVFPAKREGSARGRRRHAVVVEALVPPSAARVAIRIATRVATVYTNAPKRRREAILANLCTLLRRRPGGDAHAVLAVTQPPTHTSSRSFHF